MNREDSLTDEVKSNNVVVSLHGVELDGETSRVTSLVWKFSTESHSRESDKDGCLFPDRR
jgi:hypothetical protein